MAPVNRPKNYDYEGEIPDPSYVGDQHMKIARLATMCVQPWYGNFKSMV